MNLDNTFALLIGVGADLPITVSDATSIAKILKDPEKAAYNPENICLLTEKEATKHKVLTSLEDLLEKANKVEEATVIIYYSGHGGIYSDQIDSEIKDNYYLLTYGYDKSKRDETMILGEEFSQIINKINAKKLLVMLDCCHAAGMLGTKSLIKLKSPDDKIINSNVELLRKLRTGEGRVFITSCDDDEQSVILPDSKNSLFTEVILEALSGIVSNEGYVRMIDLLYYVLTEVPKRVKEYNHIQRPIINKIESLSPDYYLCKVSNIPPSEQTANNYENVKSLVEQFNVSNSHHSIDIDSIEKTINKNTLDKDIEIVESHIIRGETQKAISAFLKLSSDHNLYDKNDIILIASRYNSLIKDKMIGVISDERYRIQLIQINNSLQYFLTLYN